MSKHPAHHVLDIYGAHLHLAWTRKQWRRLAKEHDFLTPNPPDSAGWSQFATWEPNSGLRVPHLVLWIDLKAHGDETTALVDCVAHESAHAASQLLHWVGHPIEGTDEPHAYLVGWIAGWIWRHLHAIAA